LRGDGWWDVNGCCVPSAHRIALFSSDGELHPIEVFAVDWVQLVDGQPATGSGSQVTDFYGYGQPVYAATGGEVVSARNDLPDAPINESGNGNPTLKGPKDYGGNGLVVRIREAQYAVYAHLIAGSVTHQVGDRIRTGDVVGRLGNSGNSTVPHLHFGIQSTPKVLGSDSLPFVISSYTVTGTATTNAAGTGLDVTPKNLPQRDTMPLVGDVADFGEAPFG
jgi:murein DD-endopeptidase MepM/ murein hydrolase activator NlpD